MLELARELGLALANSPEFINMKLTQSAFESNEAITALMNELHEKRDRLVRIVADMDGDKLEAVSITNDIDRLEQQLSESPLYSEMVSAEAAFTLVLKTVNDEINACIGGTTSSTCDGDCGSCGGCKH